MPRPPSWSHWRPTSWMLSAQSTTGRSASTCITVGDTPRIPAGVWYAGRKVTSSLDVAWANPEGPLPLCKVAWGSQAGTEGYDEGNGNKDATYQILSKVDYSDDVFM